MAEADLVEAAVGRYGGNRDGGRGAGGYGRNSRGGGGRIW